MIKEEVKGAGGENHETQLVKGDYFSIGRGKKEVFSDTPSICSTLVSFKARRL